MIEPAFAEMGLDWRYLTVEVRPGGPGSGRSRRRAMNWRGFNCTIPHKVAVIPFLDELNPAAEVIGSRQLRDQSRRRLIGDNTDGKGFLQSLLACSGLKETRAVILERRCRQGDRR